MEEKLDMKIVKKDGCYCLQFGDGRFDGMNSYLSKWYEIRQELDEAMPNLTDEERKKKIFDYKSVAARREFWYVIEFNITLGFISFFMIFFTTSSVSDMLIPITSSKWR